MDILDSQNYTPMMQQYLEIKKDYTDFIVFFRLGDFYEMFFTDAIVASRELEIVLTGRDAGVDERVPMCGVPYHAASIYVDKLIEKGYKVAIVEQVEDPALAKGIVKRDVIQLITPGTIIEDGSLDAKSNNFIAALSEAKTTYVLAYSDLTTGENLLVTLPKDAELLANELMNLNVRELIVSTQFHQRVLRNHLESRPMTLSVADDINIPQFYRNLVAEIYEKSLLEAFGRLINYLLKTKKRELMHLQKVQVFESSQYLRIDNNSKRNLELTETYRSQNKKGSLFGLLDVCGTAMGSRYLKQTILRPLIDKNRIESRYSLVEDLNDDFIAREEIESLLKQVYDLERIIGRISFGNANAKDLINLSRSLKVMPQVREIVESIHNDYGCELVSKFSDLGDLCQLIDSAIIENPPLSIKEGGIIKPGYSTELDEIKSNHFDAKQWIEKFESDERERTGIKKLRIGYNRVFGYYIEVT
ncbi:MAG: DNA mismatch repair protein MutS, partial [Bacilli bacterium]|nr:DNA mismatch repair protein MutS [Bacilli bacterium]